LTKRVLSVALVFVLGGAASGAAQDVQVDLVPYVGLYVAATSLAEFSVTDPEGTLKFGQEPGLLLGGRVDLWFARDFGLEGNFAYAFSNAKLEFEDGSGVSNLCEEDTDCSAYVWMAGGSVLYRFLYPEGASYSIYMSAGLAIVGHGGSFWSDFEGNTDIAGTFGVGFTQDFSQRVGVRVNAEYYIYSFQLTADGEDLADSKLQGDLALSAALAFHLGS